MKKISIFFLFVFALVPSAIALCESNSEAANTITCNTDDIVAQSFYASGSQFLGAALYREDSAPISGLFFIMSGFESLDFGSSLASDLFFGVESVLYGNVSAALQIGQPYTVAWVRDTMGFATTLYGGSDGTGSSFYEGSWHSTEQLQYQICYDGTSSGASQSPFPAFPSPSASSSAAVSSPSRSASPSVSPSKSPSPSRSASPSVSPSKSPSPSVSPSKSPSPSVSPSKSPSPSTSPSKSPSSSPSSSSSPSASSSVTPSNSASASTTPSSSPSPVSPSTTPSGSVTPSGTPSGSVTPSVTASASTTPSSSPSPVSPSTTPSSSPSVSRTPSPSIPTTPSKSASASGSPGVLIYETCSFVNVTVKGKNVSVRISAIIDVATSQITQVAPDHPLNQGAKQSTDGEWVQQFYAINDSSYAYAAPAANYWKELVDTNSSLLTDAGLYFASITVDNSNAAVVPESKSHSGLTTGSIIAIAVAVPVGTLAVIGAAFYLLKKKRSQSNDMELNDVEINPTHQDNSNRSSSSDE